MKNPIVSHGFFNAERPVSLIASHNVRASLPLFASPCTSPWDHWDWLRRSSKSLRGWPHSSSVGAT